MLRLLLTARAVLVQLILVGLASSEVNSSGSARVPTTFTQVQNRNCRFRYTIETSQSECNIARCWMNSNVFRKPDLVQPLPLQNELCVLQVPAAASQLILSAPLERVDLLSPNCSWNVLKHHTTIYKILGNGSRININDHNNQYQFTVDVGNSSDLWCESPNLQPVPDPYKDHCSIVITISSMKMIYTGAWQMLVSLPTTPVAAKTTASAELASVHELYVKVTDWPCDVCFGAQSKCVKLNFDDFYHSGVVSLERQAKMPTYSVLQGESFCAVLQSTTDVKGSWVFASNTTSLTAESLLFFDPEGDGTTMVSANTMDGVSLYGEYHNCLHIDQMRDALDGLFMYQHSGYYAATHNNSGLAVIHVRVDHGDRVQMEMAAELNRHSQELYVAYFSYLWTLLLCAVTAFIVRRRPTVCKSSPAWCECFKRACARERGTAEERETIVPRDDTGG